jgi:hypothetical protein
VWWGQ